MGTGDNTEASHPPQQACGICIEHIFGSVGISACEKLVIKHDT